MPNHVVQKRKEVEEVKEDEMLVEKEKGEVENETGGVENEQEEKNSEEEKNNKKKRYEGENNERLIDVDSILRRTKSQILAEGEKEQKVPPYVKLQYVHTLTCQKRKKNRKGSSRSLWSYSLSCR